MYMDYFPCSSYVLADLDCVKMLVLFGHQAIIKDTMGFMCPAPANTVSSYNGDIMPYMMGISCNASDMGKMVKNNALPIIIYNFCTNIQFNQSINY